MIWALVRIVMIGALPSFLIFIGKNDAFFAWWSAGDRAFDLEWAQFVSFLIGLSITGIWLPTELIYLKRKLDRKEKLLRESRLYHKMTFIELIESELGLGDLGLSTQIFKPQKRWIPRLWNSLVHGKTVLQLYTFEGMSDAFPYKTLSFSVGKKSVEGLVGKAYKTKLLCIDFDLDDNDYQLTEVQKNKIGNLEFCATIPIFNSSESKINAILSVDSTKKLRLNKSQRKSLENFMRNYAALVDKHLNN